jgi:hypothetical protein
VLWRHSLIKLVQIGKGCDANSEGSGNTPRREQRDLGISNTKFEMKVCSELQPKKKLQNQAEMT